MSSHSRHIVPLHVAEVRLSDYVHHAFPEIGSRKGGKKAIKRKEVFVDGKVGVTGIWVKPGMEITWKPSETTKPPYRLIIPVIFEDDHLAVLNKPAGIPTSGNQFKTLENAAIHNLSESPESDALSMAKPVHRLDAKTSGLVLIAKTRSAQIHLSAQFENREVQKTYRAIVVGKLSPSGKISNPVNDKPAETKYISRKITRSLKCEWLTTVDLLPQTGRTHQLRKHLSGIGHPILGDIKYGLPGLTLKKKGLFLSATGLSFHHPITKKTIELFISPPAKFYKRIEYEQYRYQKFKQTNFPSTCWGK